MTASILPKASPFDLTGRDVWVIGGAGFLGTATVRQLAAHQASVLCADLSGRAAQMVEKEQLGEKVTPADLDAGDCEAIQRFVRAQIELRGTPQALVIMTYRSFPQAMDDLRPEQFDEANQVSLSATFHAAREVGQAMAKAGRGSIVLFSSMYGTIAPDPGMYPPPLHPNSIEYGVGKAGIQQMARYLAVHWGASNVRCNSISPGTFPFVSQQTNEEFVRRLQDKCPMGRVGRPEEIAGAVHFLVSEASTYVTGHNLAVDGGWTAW